MIALLSTRLANSNVFTFGPGDGGPADDSRVVNVHQSTVLSRKHLMTPSYMSMQS